MMNTDVNIAENICNSQDFTHIPKIRVIVRKRPINKKESSKGETDVIENVNNSVIVKELK